MSDLSDLRQITEGYFVVLDTETTGLNAGEICQIAIIDCFGQVLLETLVKPTLAIPPGATAVHHITDQDVADAPAWTEVHLMVLAALSSHPVVVYNARYDRRMMHQSAAAHGMPKTDWKTIAPWVCAMEAAAEFNGDWNEYHQSYRWLKLSVAAEMCQVPVVAAHNALGDCLMTLGVVQYITRHDR